METGFYSFIVYVAAQGITMIFSCSKCGKKFRISVEKIPEKGGRVRCGKCKNIIKVSRDIKEKSSTPEAGEKQKPASNKINVEHEKAPVEKPPVSPPPEKGTSPEKKNQQEQVIPVKKRRAAPEEKSGGAPAWVVTFADLATLMLTFFVLLLSFANTDIQKFKDMLGSVQDAFGVSKETKGAYQSVLKGTEEDKEGASDATSEKAKEESERQKIAGEIEKAAESIGETKNISIQIGAEGVRVRIKGAYFFGPGSAHLKKTSLPFLKNISDLMETFPFKLKVEGHTDNIPISTSQFPSNWELSAFRATTVLRYFSEQKGIDPSRLTAIGYAENKPIASNDEAWSRAKNRRVEFVFFK